MKIFIANDHAASEQKSSVENFLKAKYPDWDIVNLGTDSNERVNYPDYAQKVCQGVLKNSNSKGILICGSGIGMSMAANRYAGIRAALCCSEEEAKLSREHNDANVLCLGARLNKVEKLLSIVSTWLEAKFEGGRHQERINLFNDLGQKL